MIASLLCAVALSAAQDPKPVSYARDVAPILKKSCAGCHNPEKKKGKLDMTTFAALQAGGKQKTPWVAGQPEKSILIEMVSGAEPEMPEKGDPLTKDEIALLSRWIKEGAKDDSAAAAPLALPVRRVPTVYTTAPVISTLAWSPDGKTLVVSGHHEVLLHRPDGSGIAARLVGESPRIETAAFSADGKWLVVSGGSPAKFGEIQIWDPAAGALSRSFRVTSDLLYGVSLSPDATRVAFGCTDKSVRMIDAADGKELIKFDNHSDWSFGTLFTMDGKQLLSGSRDRAMKLIDAANGRLIDDVNKLLEPILCIARHPKMDQVLYGGALGTPRIYRISDNQKRTAANIDTNLVKEFERQPGPVRAVAWRPDGEAIAVGGIGEEARIYSVKDGKRLFTLGGHGGAVFAAAFSPDGKTLATGGHDGQLRLWDAEAGKLIKAFIPVPIQGK